MPITVYRYGRSSKCKQVMSPEVQAAMTLKEFEYQKSTGHLPEDAIDGGFCADPDTSRSVEFLKRKMGVLIALRAKPEDRIIVAAYDRLIGSPIDCCHTLNWALGNNIHLVIMDLRLDMSTNHGRMICQIIAAVKENERLEIGRRTRESMAHRRANGLPTNRCTPIGWVKKTIVPLGGGKPMKYFLPCEAERVFVNMLIHLHDVEGISFRRLAVKLWKEKIINPRTGKYDMSHEHIEDYIKAGKSGWPLSYGVQWKPPGFKYKVVNTKPIDFNRVSA